MTTLRIGNGKDGTWNADIIVDEWSVSRQHCQVEIEYCTVVPSPSRFGLGARVAGGGEDGTGVGSSALPPSNLEPEIEAFRYRLTDLGSLNGTYVRSRRIDANTPVVLRENDTFWVGATSFVCRSGTVVSTARPVDDGQADSITPVPRGGPIVLGRAPGPGGITLSAAPLASRRHCQVERAGADYRLTDLGSTNGTWYQGRRLGPRENALLRDGDSFEIEGQSWVVRDGSLQLATKEADTPGVALEAQGVTVGDPPRLFPVSFRLRAGTLLAVVGTSGSGKSTLLKSLVGAHEPEGGRVLINGADFYANRRALISSIGYVPQEDTVHHELTVKTVLEFGAEFRRPNASLEDREAEVSRVLRDLVMDAHADKPIHVLSGGEIKRVNVGLELLTRPSLLFMDEPTSGLDPGLEKDFMQIMRRLADHGCSIVVVTHSEAIVRECDDVLVLGPGGHLWYAGPTHPDGLQKAFGTADFAEICRKVLHEPPPLLTQSQLNEARPEHYASSPFQGEGWGGVASDSDGQAVTQRDDIWRQGSRQYMLHLRRYWQILLSGTVNIGKLSIPTFAINFAVQAVVLPLILAHVLPQHAVNAAKRALELISAGYLAKVNAGKATIGGMPAAVVDSFSRNYLPRLLMGPITVLMLVILATLFGLLSGSNELTRERRIWRRERLAGMQIGPYLLSKVTVWTVLCFIHSGLLLYIVDRRIELFNDQSPVMGIYTTLALSSVVAMLMGLLISAIAETSFQAITLAGAAFFISVLFSGLISLPSDGPLGWMFTIVSVFTPSRWALGALNEGLGVPGTNEATAQSAECWLIVLAVVYLLATIILTRRRDRVS